MKFTAVVRDDFGCHIIKALIKDETHLYFQIYNKTKKLYTPVFIIPSNYGTLPYFPVYKKQQGRTKVEWEQFYKELNDYFKYTKNINRQSLVGYYNQFLLTHLISIYSKL